MLKPMKPKTTIPRNTILWALVGLFVLSGITALALSFGGDDGADEVNAVYTNAAATLAIQQLTLQAASPSVTPTTATQTPSATFTPQVSPTLFVLQTSTIAPVGGGGGGSGAVGCNNSAYVSDVTYQDDTVVTPGQAIVKTWKLQNTGTCAWTATYKVSFVSGNAMGGTTTPIGISVAPGQSADISVNMTAPATAGDALGYWILTNDSGQNFGSSFYIKVKVGGTAVTGTPATATATGTVTIPTAANNPSITLTCTTEDGGVQYKYSGTLTWEDVSNNEGGFRIYLNGSVLATVSANVTSYAVPESAAVPADTLLTFGVEAFNSAGNAALATVPRKCP